MTSKLNDVKVAYEDARRAQLVDDPLPLKRLPTWEKLSPEIRQAFIHVFFAGWKARP